MFEGLNTLPADPILGLMSLFKDDTNPLKVDLGVGVYKDELGNTPVLGSIRTAEQRVIDQQTTKAYVGPAGNPLFNKLLPQLLLGEHSTVIKEGRLAVAQTPGGCGALRVAAELIKVAKPKATIWVSDPTWGNHIPLLGNSGLEIKTYPYYNMELSSLNFDGMMSALAQIPSGDLVLLHGCCHNPSGVDLNHAQWQQVADVCVDKGIVPFVDIAYQGFGDGVMEDVFGLRLLADIVPEMMIAVSCSKNFGLYRERVGMVGMIGGTASSTKAALTHMLSIIRGIYSMPPDHGAALVAEVLGDHVLFKQWLGEVTTMRTRISDLRNQFSDEMLRCTHSNRFDFVRQQKGMFSFLGLSKHQVEQLRREHGIYMLDSSRVSIAGLNQKCLPRVCGAIALVSNCSDGRLE